MTNAEIFGEKIFCDIGSFTDFRIGAIDHVSCEINYDWLFREYIENPHLLNTLPDF